MFNPEFQQVYAMGGWADARMLAQPRVSTAQFVQDQEALYGAILSAFRLTKTAKRYTTKWAGSHYGPPDGMMVLW